MLNTPYRRYPRWFRAVSLLSALLLVVVFVVLVCCTNSDNVDVPAETPAVEETVATVTTDPVEETEPSWQLIELPQPPEYQDPKELVTIYDAEDAISSCEEFIVQCDELLDTLVEQHPQYVELQNLEENAAEYLLMYEAVLDQHWSSRELHNPVMTYIWKYLQAHDMSAAVTAGIIGNMIAEAGSCGYGDIQVNIWDGSTGKSFYGICQWSVKYTPEIANTDLDTQLDHLINSYDYAFTYWGSNYSSRYGSKFRTAQFLAMKDPYEAAIAFALCYERCNKDYVEHRGPLANKAYKYFTVLNSWPWPSPNPIE